MVYKMLFIGTPLYENKVSCEYLHGLMQTANTLNKHGLELEYTFERGTYIAINREKLVRRFLKTNHPYFLFIDSDTVFTAKNVLELLASDADVVSGIYPFRIPVKEGIANHCFRDLKYNPIDTSSNAPKMQECSFMPTGMMMIRRSVFEKLYTIHEFIFDQGFQDSEFAKALWDKEDDILSRFQGEDIHFCKIWREMGGHLFANSNVKLEHIGEHKYKL